MAIFETIYIVVVVSKWIWRYSNHEIMMSATKPWYEKKWGIIQFYNVARDRSGPQST